MFNFNGMNQYGAYGYPPPQFSTTQQGGFMNGGVSQPTQQTNGLNVPQNGFQSGQELVTVQTIDQVEQVQVQPGQRRIVMVQNSPVIAARSADNMGLVTTEYYNLSKFDHHAVAQNAQAVHYITEEQLENRLASFAESLKVPATPSKSKKEAASE